MQETSKLTFLRGMNTDLDPSVRDGASYLRAENFTSTSEGGGTIGTLENAKGNEQLTDIIFPIGHKVVGYSNIVDNTVYFTTNGIDSNIYYNKHYKKNVHNVHSIGGFQIPPLPASIEFTIDGNTTLVRYGIDINSPVSPQQFADYINTKTSFNTYYTAEIDSVDTSRVIFIPNSFEVANNMGAGERYDVNLVDTWTSYTAFNLEYRLKSALIYEETEFKLVYTDAASTSKLKFSLLPEHRIIAVGRQELTILEKVYWVDGLNEYRYINLNSNYIGKEATVFNSIPPNDLTSSIITEVIPSSGGYTAGTVYHSYQFYTLNGAASTISSVSNPAKLSRYTSLKDGGSELEDDTECSVKVNITDIPNTVLETYNRIRIYAVHYNNQYNPTINVVAERNLNNTNISIIDTGTILDTIEVDQYITYNQTTYIPEALTSKENNIFMGNLKESTFSSDVIDNWDSRAYRFYDHTTAYNHARITSAEDTSKYILVSDGTMPGAPIYTVGESNISGINVGDPIPVDFDCANPYNSIFTNSLYSRTVINGGSRYQSNHTTIGGEGLNVAYDFVDRGKYIDRDVYVDILSNTPVHNIEGDEYSDLTESTFLNMEECQDGEVYRVGIKFYNKKGQSSFVKWVGDILWEEQYDTNYGGLGLGTTFEPTDLGPNYTGYKYSKRDKAGVDADKITARAKVLRVTITPPEDSEIASWQVVRAVRTDADASVVGNGKLQQTRTSDIYERPRTDTGLDEYDANKTLFKFFSPELQFNSPSSLDLFNYKVRVYNKYNFTSFHTVSLDINGKASIQKATTLTGLSKANVYTSDNLIKINESKWVIPSYSQDSINSPLTKIGNYTYTNNSYIHNTGLYEYAGAGNSSFVLDLETVPIIVNGVDDTSSADLYASILKDTDTTRYGGLKYQDILNTVYIPFSKITPITVANQLAHRGDVISAMYYFMQEMFYDVDTDPIRGNQLLTVLPLQSRIDVRRRLDKILDYYVGLDELDGRADISSTMFIAETIEKGISLQGSVYKTDIGDLYRYNPAYSAQPSFEISIPKPFDFIEEPHSTTKVLASEKKINGEREDQWTNFLPNNFIEVNSSYGGINTMLTEGNILFFWQDIAFGKIAVNERALIGDDTGSALSLGTGGVLERYDYISTEVGSTFKYNISASENGLYWFYTPKNKIYSYTNQLSELSTTAGINTYLRGKNSSSYPIAVSDFINNETLFRIEDEVLVYDWLAKSFTGVYTYTPDWLFKRYDGNITSIPLVDNTVWEHNIEDSNRCSYYGSLYPSTLSHMCNTDYTNTKVFDNLAWHSTSTLNDINQYEDTFNTYRVYTDYQNTDWQPIIWRRKERSFTTIIPRDRVNAPQTDNVDIFLPTSLDATQSFKRRIRDKSIVIDLNYNNDGNHKFNIPYLDVYYRKSIR